MSVQTAICYIDDLVGDHHNSTVLCLLKTIYYRAFLFCKHECSFLWKSLISIFILPRVSLIKIVKTIGYIYYHKILKTINLLYVACFIEFALFLLSATFNMLFTHQRSHCKIHITIKGVRQHYQWLVNVYFKFAKVAWYHRK